MSGWFNDKLIYEESSSLDIAAKTPKHIIKFIGLPIAKPQTASGRKTAQLQFLFFWTWPLFFWPQLLFFFGLAAVIFVRCKKLSVACHGEKKLL